MSLEKSAILLHFCVPWCSTCKSFSRTLDDVVDTFSGGEADDVVFARVDAKAEPYLSDLYKVDAYPTLVLFRLDRAHVTYSGPLSSHAIGSWLRRMLHPLQPVSSVSALVSFLAEPPRALVFCAPPLDEEAILLKHSAVVQAAEESANVRFGLVTDQPVTRYFELSAGRVPGFPPEYGSCMLVGVSLGGAKVFEGDFSDTAELSRFLDTLSLPLLPEISPSTLPSLVSSGLPLMLAYIDKEQSNTALMHALQDVAIELYNSMIVATVDGGEYSVQARRVGIDPEYLPALVIDDYTDGTYYRFDLPQEPGEIFVSGPKISKFAHDFLRGALTPDTRVSRRVSEPPHPAHAGADVVERVSGPRLQQLLESGLVVMLQICAHYCGHCKAFQPVFQQLARQHSQEDSQILFAYLDTTEDDLPRGLQHIITVDKVPTTVLLLPTNTEPRERLSSVSESSIGADSKHLQAQLTEAEAGEQKAEVGDNGEGRTHAGSSQRSHQHMGSARLGVRAVEYSGGMSVRSLQDFIAEHVSRDSEHHESVHDTDKDEL